MLYLGSPGFLLNYLANHDKIREQLVSLNKTISFCRWFLWARIVAVVMCVVKEILYKSKIFYWWIYMCISYFRTITEVSAGGSLL